MKSPGAFALGRGSGFLAALVIFATVLFFVTGRLGLHAFGYLNFVTGFAAVYGAARLSGRAVRKWR